ncbi:cyclophilin-like fold protein [Pedobacter duraquae]|uniref:Cyclophilin-like n=1 Tax=Pedobacter duraquae TaxID=425511 RepID=A0A4R6INN8_9SPHI|nr:cyclophilin-like fold protein [Pedobacter duraquae]TDO23731.1 Cyclophilin-like [Pedobacter duraquae]
MKSLITLIAILLTFSCCTASCGKDEKTIAAQNNDVGNTNPLTSKMKITIGTAVFTATLYDNASANAFKAKLPLSINMTELNGNEKYYDLPNSLPTNSSVGGNIKVGDLTLYGNNTLVLFYKNFSTSYSYTKLGYVDNPIGLATALGNGNALVKFENN